MPSTSRDPVGALRRAYFFVGPRPFREARLRSYIVREHRRGRPLASVLEDSYVSRCGTRALCWRVLCDPATIAALEANVREAMTAARPPGAVPAESALP